jgi:hypothetical protein
MSPHSQCGCPECVQARREMLFRTHPVHKKNWKVIEDGVKKQ